MKALPKQVICSSIKAMSNKTTVLNGLKTGAYQKRILMVLMLWGFGLLAQVPQQLGYQAVVRDSQNQLISQANVGILVSIIHGSPSGSVAFAESHSVQTNVNGLFTIAIGNGTAVSGSFENINWQNGPLYIKTDIDPNGGTQYTLSSTQVFQSVPYALFASNGLQNGDSSGEMLYYDGSKWKSFAAGNEQYILSVCNGLPIWTHSGVCPGEETRPEVLTASVQEVMVSSALASGLVLNDGGKPILERGFCWSTEPNPSTSQNKLSMGTGKGLFSIKLNGLSSNQTYYVRAYAQNTLGVSYGQQLVFVTQASPRDCNPTVTDIDGNSYPVVKIGDICWMGSNLKVKHFNNGDNIQAASQSEWTALSNPFHTAYNNSLQNENLYGLLYNAFAANDARGICPIGWTLPEQTHWQTLMTNLSINTLTGGSALKSSTGWEVGTQAGKNTSGLGILGSGIRGADAVYLDLNQKSGLWIRGQNSNQYSAIFLHYNQNRIEFASQPSNMGLSIRCVKDQSQLDTTGLSLPTVSTLEAIEINSTKAQSGGRISEDGGASISHKGLVWSNASNPTLGSGNHLDLGSGGGEYRAEINGLSPNTTFYVKAYAINALGTQYGQEESFTTRTSPLMNQCNEHTATDADGNHYELIQIENQCWFKSNLRTSKFRNGDDIITGLSQGQWQSTQTAAMASYNDSFANDAVFGKLYNWFAATDSRELCPAGWRTPNRNDWYLLAWNLDANADSLASVTSQLAGGLIKSDSNLWYPPNASATNASQFSALPSGYKLASGGYQSKYVEALWWSSANQNQNAEYFHTSYADAYLYHSANSKQLGLSIRCIREDSGITLGASLPELQTEPIKEIGHQTAKTGGRITNDGGGMISSRGVCWNTATEPTTAHLITNNGGGGGQFEANLTALMPSTTYYVRAYATNSAGTAYGNELEFTTLRAPFQCGDAIVDTSGISYPTVEIGPQCWLKGNFSSPAFADGSNIPFIQDNANWNNQVYSAYGYYNNDAANDLVFGKLYKGHVVNDLRGICPSGWRIPLKSDWQILVNTLNGYNEAGGSLKSGSNWNVPNALSNSSSGFDAFGGGFRDKSGNSTGMFQHTSYWTQEPVGNTQLMSVRLRSQNTELAFIPQELNAGAYVRCVKETFAQPPVLPVVISHFPSEIDHRSAVAGGEVLHEGNAQVTSRGLVWSTSPNVSLTQFSGILTAGSGLGSFNLELNLLFGTTYYVRAYAATSSGQVAYGEEMRFSTPSGSAPSVSTDSAISILDNQIEMAGNVIDDNGSPIIEKGFVYTQKIPGIIESQINLNSPLVFDTSIASGGLGSFSLNITNLLHHTEYAIRAYATNALGTQYGPVVYVSTSCGSSQVLDIDGNNYNLVKIGNQCWFKENLKTTKLRNGTPLTFSSAADSVWVTTGHQSIAKYGVYNDQPANFQNYGMLYNYWAVDEDSRIGLCPTGFKVPDWDDWYNLREYLKQNGYNYDFSVGGAHENTHKTAQALASDIPGIWANTPSNHYSPIGTPGLSANQNNRSGFDARPGGVRNWDGEFSSINEIAGFWINAWNHGRPLYLEISHQKFFVFINQGITNYGLSIRCIKE